MTALREPLSSFTPPPRNELPRRARAERALEPYANLLTAVTGIVATAVLDRVDGRRHRGAHRH